MPKNMWIRIRIRNIAFNYPIILFSLLKGRQEGRHGDAEKGRGGLDAESGAGGRVQRLRARRRRQTLPALHRESDLVDDGPGHSGLCSKLGGSRLHRGQVLREPGQRSEQGRIS